MRRARRRVRPAIGDKLKGSRAKGGRLKIEFYCLRSIGDRRDAGRRIVGNRGAGSGNPVDVDHVSSDEILQQGTGEAGRIIDD